MAIKGLPSLPSTHKEDWRGIQKLIERREKKKKRRKKGEDKKEKERKRNGKSPKLPVQYSPCYCGNFIIYIYIYIFGRKEKIGEKVRNFISTLDFKRMDEITS